MTYIFKRMQLFMFPRFYVLISRVTVKSYQHVSMFFFRQLLKVNVFSLFNAKYICTKQKQINKQTNTFSASNECLQRFDVLLPVRETALVTNVCKFIIFKSEKALSNKVFPIAMTFEYRPYTHIIFKRILKHLYLHIMSMYQIDRLCLYRNLV